MLRKVLYRRVHVHVEAVPYEQMYGLKVLPRMPVGIGRLSSRKSLIMRSIQFIDQVLSAKLVLNNMRQLWELQQYLRWHKAGIVVPIFTLIVHSESNQII